MRGNHITDQAISLSPCQLHIPMRRSHSAVNCASSKNDDVSDGRLSLSEKCFQTNIANPDDVALIKLNHLYLRKMFVSKIEGRILALKKFRYMLKMIQSSKPNKN